MFCTKCGELLGVEAEYCSRCGTRAGLPSAAEQRSQIGAGGAPVYQNSVRPGASTSGIAIAAIIVVFFFSLLGLILGYVARSDIRKSDGLKLGIGMANAAIVLGWIFTILGIVLGVYLSLYSAFLSGLNSGLSGY